MTTKPHIYWVMHSGWWFDMPYHNRTPNDEDPLIDYCMEQGIRWCPDNPPNIKGLTKPLIFWSKWDKWSFMTRAGTNQRIRSKLLMYCIRQDKRWCPV